MTEEVRWSVRGVEVEALEMLREVYDECCCPMGYLLSEAIRVWYDGLPEEEEEGE